MDARILQQWMLAEKEPRVDPTPYEPMPDDQPADPVTEREQFEEEVKDLFVAADEAQRSGDDGAVETLVGRLQAAADRAEEAGGALLDDAPDEQR